MMICLKETTKDLHPHTYLVNDSKSKMLAYRRVDGVINVFSKPLCFATRYRKFETVDDFELVQSVAN
jgi:hypothetical protein